VVPYVAGTACDAQHPYAIVEATRRALAYALALPPSQIRLVSPTEIVASGQAAVLGHMPASVVHDRVRTVVMGLFAAPVVSSWAVMHVRPSPLVDWLGGGITAGLLALGIASLMAIADRLIATSGHRRHLLQLGMVPRQLAMLEGWQFAAPYVVVCGVGLLVGGAICAQIVVVSHAAVPWYPLGVTLGLTLVAGVLGTICVAVFGIRSVQDARPAG
jgi:hypothetical protein